MLSADAARFQCAVCRAKAIDTMRQGLAVLAQRAKDAGQLRPDFDRSDLSLVLMANSGITAASAEEALAASRRLLPPSAPLGLYPMTWPMPA